VMMLFAPEERSEVLLSVGVFVLCVIAYAIRARVGGPIATQAEHA
jgi:hypothetical protein